MELSKEEEVTVYLVTLTAVTSAVRTGALSWRKSTLTLNFSQHLDLIAPFSYLNSEA